MEQVITKITHCPNIALVTLPEIPSDSRIAAEILTAISDAGVNVDMISQTAPQGSTISLAFSISMDSMALLLPVINSLKPLHPGLKCEISGGMRSKTRSRSAPKNSAPNPKKCRLSDPNETRFAELSFGGDAARLRARPGLRGARLRAVE